MRVGLLGGTFDPPHIGHLIAAQDVLVALGLDRVLFIPAHAPPHKRSRAITPAAIRLEMLEAAIGDDARFGVDTLELERKGISYTVDTLRELREREPRWELYLLLGTDQARDLGSWREPAEIVRLARLVVMARDGVASVSLPWPAETVGVTRIDVSSTGVRNRMAEGRPIRYVVPDGVLRVIEREGLYRTPAATAIEREG